MRLSNSFGFTLFLLLLREKHEVFLLICLFLLITKVFLKFKRILFGKNIRWCTFNYIWLISTKWQLQYSTTQMSIHFVISECAMGLGAFSSILVNGCILSQISQMFCQFVFIRMSEPDPEFAKRGGRVSKLRENWLTWPLNRLNLHDLVVKRGGGSAESAHTWIQPWMLCIYRGGGNNLILCFMLKECFRTKKFKKLELFDKAYLI